MFERKKDEESPRQAMGSLFRATLMNAVERRSSGKHQVRDAHELTRERRRPLLTLLNPCFSSNETNKGIMKLMTDVARTTITDAFAKHSSYSHQVSDAHVLTRERRRPLLYSSVSRNKTNKGIRKLMTAVAARTIAGELYLNFSV